MVEIDLTGLVQPERFEMMEMSEDGASAQFIVEPLERGFGHTLGNSVRRVLLSSLPGAAVWAFRIDGVVHEHQTIQGVVEDVHQVIQNLKSLVLRLDEDVDEAVLEIRAEKAGALTAGMIEPPAGVDILEPDHHILTLQDDRELNIELRVNKGRGFVLADQHKVPSGEPVDLVRIDSIYNPVRRANFTVEETRVGQRTDFDRLTVQVETDGSVPPDDALGYAAELVRKHLEYMLDFRIDPLPADMPPGAVRVEDHQRQLLHRKLDDLGELTVRTRNALKAVNIERVRDLIVHTEDEMLEIDKFGKKSLEEVVQFLGEHDLQLGWKLDEGDDGRVYFVPRGAAAAAAAETEGEE